MSDINAPPEADNIPTTTTKTLDLTADQRDALFGADIPTEEGKTYTVTLKAGPVIDGGSQTFEVVDDGDGDDDSTLPPSDPEEESSPDDEKKALGYDRAALKRRRKKPAPFTSGSLDL